ncbi:MAG: DEAD/DEAH box helicase, partial [Fusobacteriota bacterium]
NLKNFEDNDIEYLKYKIAPFIMRRTKKEVLKELPEKNEKIIRLELLPKQRIIYNDVLSKMRNKINLAMKKNNNAYFTILGALTYLREVCDHPKLIKKDINESIKVEIFEELVLDAIENGHKILVFSQFVKMLEILEKVAEKNNIKYEKLTGKTKNRMEMVKRFNKKENIKIFFISLKAGGTGLNLTSADTIIHIDPWWNPMVERQATDRAHRIGQTQKVNVYKFITKDTIEEKILDIQKRKQQIFDNLIEGSKKELDKISLNELVKLFN